MNKRLCKRRVAFLLAFAMLVTQLSVPDVYATQTTSEEENSVSVDETEVVDIPDEYISLDDDGTQNVLDLSRVQEAEPESQKATISEEIPEEYKNIPVIGGETNSDVSEKNQNVIPDEAIDEENVAGKEPELTLPEIIPYIGNEQSEDVAADVPANTDTAANPDRVEADAEDAENTIAIDTFVEGEILIGNEATTYYFTPETAGDYLLAITSGQYFSVNVYDEASNLIAYVWSYGTDCVRLMKNLQAEATYHIEIQANEQCNYTFAVLKTETLSEGTKTEVTTSVCRQIGESNSAAYVKLSLTSENTQDYHVVVGDTEVEASADGSYEFMLLGSKDLVLWKENNTSDKLTVQLTEYAIRSIEMKAGESLLSQSAEGKIVKKDGYGYYDLRVETTS